MFLHQPIELPIRLAQPYLLLYRLSELTLLNQLLIDLNWFFYYYYYCNSTTIERKIIYCVWFQREGFSLAIHERLVS